MDITFDDAKLQRVVESSKLMQRKFGTKCASRLKNRMVSLRAAESVADLPGNWHELKGDRSGQWAADLEHPKRLIIRPRKPFPSKEPIGIDWTEVREVVVVEVVDYHK